MHGLGTPCSSDINPDLLNHSSFPFLAWSALFLSGVIPFSHVFRKKTMGFDFQLLWAQAFPKYMSVLHGTLRKKLTEKNCINTQQKWQFLLAPWSFIFTCNHDDMPVIVVSTCFSCHCKQHMHTHTCTYTQRHTQACMHANTACVLMYYLVNWLWDAVRCHSGQLPSWWPTQEARAQQEIVCLK